MKATGSGRVVSPTVGDLMEGHYAVVYPYSPLADANPTVGALMARFTAVVYKRRGYLVSRPAWLTRQPRKPT